MKAFFFPFLHKEIEKLWETLGIRENESSWVDRCLDSCEFVHGRYQVNLPFKENKRFMEDNYTLAEKRLTSLKKKLEKEPWLMNRYDQIIKNQLKDGIVETVVSEPIVGEVTYLPHRAVIRDDKDTTRVRIVFDCSAKNKSSGGSSLNDCLYKGPVLFRLK